MTFEVLSARGVRDIDSTCSGREDCVTSYRPLSVLVWHVTVGCVAAEVSRGGGIVKRIFHRDCKILLEMHFEIILTK